MRTDVISLGIDTSNYKTSVAAVASDGTIISDNRRFLEVKKGRRGLRQSEAFFQHVKNLPMLLDIVYADIEDAGYSLSDIGAVSVSERPRPVEGSYMPVFTAGSNYGKVIASTLKVPYFGFSHQENHIKAVQYYTEFRDSNRFMSFHFSGGTTEALSLDGERIEIAGATKDIAFGQLIDRLGTAMGYPFPSGEYLDKEACNFKDNSSEKNPFSRIKIGEDNCINLSGIETQVLRAVDDGMNTDKLIYFLFERIGETMIKWMNHFNKTQGYSDFIFAGGVSSSLFIRKYIEDNKSEDVNPIFGRPQLASDNAVGTALLGGERLWQ